MLLLMVNCLSSNINIINNKRIFKILINCSNISGWSNKIDNRISIDRRYICSRTNKIKRRYRWNRYQIPFISFIFSIFISLIHLFLLLPKSHKYLLFHLQDLNNIYLYNIKAYYLYD